MIPILLFLFHTQHLDSLCDSTHQQNHIPSQQGCICIQILKSPTFNHSSSFYSDWLIPSMPCHPLDVSLFTSLAVYHMTRLFSLIFLLYNSQ